MTMSYNGGCNHGLPNTTAIDAAPGKIRTANDRALDDALADFTAACERTVAGGRCTGCEEEAAELLPWTPRERLCWACTDLQLDLMAKAIGELVTS